MTDNYEIDTLINQAILVLIYKSGHEKLNN